MEHYNRIVVYENKTYESFSKYSHNPFGLPQTRCGQWVCVTGRVSWAICQGKGKRCTKRKEFKNRGLGVIMVMNYCQLGQNQKQVQTGFSCNSPVF